MATIIGVGMQMTASASGMTKGLSEAEKSLRSLQAAAKENQLRFRELTGVLSALPGPVGNVAGRMSGLASAGEGLSRVFSGGLRQSISGVGSAVAGLVNPFTISVGAVAGLGLAARTVAQGLLALEDRVENLGNTADKLGISFEFVQTLDEAARRSGSSIESVSAAFGRLQKSVLGVDEESKAAQAALENIGVTAAQLQALKPEDQYLLIGRRLSAIEDPARRTAASISLFGRAGADLLPFFRNIGGAATDLERVGAALSTSQRRDIDEFGNAMDRLAVATKGAGEQIFASFAPAGEVIANSLAEAAGAIAQFVQEQNSSASFSREFAELQRGLINRRATDAERELIVAGKTAEEVLARVEAQAEILRETGRFVGLTDALVETALAGNRAAGEVEQVADAADQIQQLSAKSQESLDRAIQRVGEYGQAGFDATLRYQEGLREIDALVTENELTEQQAAQARKNATAEYDQQIAIIKQNVDEKNKAADEAKKAADRELDAIQSVIDKTAERSRIEREFGGDEARARNDADLQRIRDAIAETEAVIAKARDAGNAQQIATAASRLAELDQTQAALEASQEDFARAAEFAAQGFADGFREAFAATDEDISKLIVKAGEFGQAGFEAALQLQDGIREAQSLVEEGLYTREAYERDVERQQRLFENRIAQLEQAAQKQKELDEKLAEDRRKVNEFVDQQLALQAFNGDSGRLEASRRVLEIEAEIARVEEEQKAARQANDQSAVRAATNRLAQLDQVAAKERDIATGAVQAREEAEKRLQDQQQQYAKAQEDQQKQIQQAQQQFQQELARQQQAEYERQVKRITDLNTLGERQVNTADVRTQEGAALVLNLAANAQDPALIEARLQSKYLKQINENIQAEARERSNRIVAIAGANLAGGF